MGDFVLELLGLIIRLFLVPSLVLLALAGVAIGTLILLADLGILGGSFAAEERKLHKQLPYDRHDRVRLSQSPLFLALLRQIEDGELKTLYVNPHMACVNFTDLGNVPESNVLDFQKCGWAPIPQGRVNQYMRRLLAAARRTPYVQSATIKWQELTAKPYLSYGGQYDRRSYPDKCPVLEITYSNRVRRQRGLKSFRR